ncbi:hypothetical protein HDV02_003761 [Globomyces sp. JEL0801]|nr:hypothetical protein HDV02_003761 [Globomyces sp. JEL0801]
MNYAMEAVSVFSWWASFHTFKSIFPKDVPFTAASGGLSGMVLFSIAYPVKNTRYFPESLIERNIIPVGSNWNIQTGARLAASHAVFFTVYTGFRDNIYKSRSETRPKSRDSVDFVNDFLCGSVASLCYRATSLAYFRGPVQNPVMTLKSAPKALLFSMLAMGTVCAAFETMDYEIKSRLSSSADQ